jgi:hypothetical protein
VKRRTQKPRAAKRVRRSAVEAVPVTAAQLRALRKELNRRMRRPGHRANRTGAPPKAVPMRWNPDPEEVQRSVAQLVLTIVEFLRQLMERQAIRRMEQKTLTKKEVEAVGLALMRLEKAIRDIGKRFGLTPEDLNLDLGSLKLM